MSTETPTILLVESHADERDMYADYLTFCGFDVVAVATTDEALQHIAGTDLLVTAVGVRGSFDGIELIHRVRDDETLRRMPVVVVTARITARERARALAAGTNVFLAKPCFPDVLATEVGRLLSRRHVRRGLA